MIRRLLAELPPSDRDIPEVCWESHQVGMPPRPGWRAHCPVDVIGFRGPTGWTTRTYRNDRHPAPLDDLRVQLGYGIWSLGRSIGS